MSRNIGWGEPEQKNILNLVEALLCHADEELELDEALKTAVQVEWVSANQLRVTGKEKQKRGNRIVEVGTRKEHLVALIEKTSKRLELRNRQGSQQEKELDAIQTVIDCLRELGLFQEDDKRRKNQGYWKFTLTLQHQTASRDQNLAVVKQKWQEKTALNVPESSPLADKNIYWRDICNQVLATQQLRRQATAQQYELNIYVPLGLMERPKTPNPRPNPTGEDSRQQKEPELQIVQTYKDDAFFQKVIAENRTEKRKHIAIIGEPGAGKTTLLGELAERLPKNSPDLPICIRLADLRESTIADYLLDNWLSKALQFIDADAENVTPEIRKALKQLFAEGKVWLLLDGVDEMAATSPIEALARIREQLTDWVGKARVVLTCRLNVWDAAISNTLTNFDTYKTLEFEPDDVDEFIRQWFEEASQDEKRRNSGNETFWLEQGKRLQQQLKSPGKERIKELVRNPLRLSMLCQSWCVAERDFPETKAALYEQFTTYFFEWKQEEFQQKHRVLKETDKKQIQQALAKLALAAMESVNRFRIEKVFAIEQMEEEWFDLASELGWLVLVDRDTRTKKPVYAFFHPTFQEYFAACAIGNWHFFLNHQIPPVSSCSYRIFERQWREVILLWLGRGEIEQKQKEEFINSLVNFEDGCREWNNLYTVAQSFYEFRAYFLAVAGIGEFQDYSQTDEVIAQIVWWSIGYFRWSVGYLDTEKQGWVYFLHEIRDAAREVLQQTHRLKAINALIQLLNSSDLDDDTHWQVAENLGKIDQGNPKAINTLVQLLTSTALDNVTRWRVAESLWAIDPGNPKAIDTLVQLLTSPALDNFTRWQVAESLVKIDQQKAIDILEQLLSSSNSDDGFGWLIARSLGKCGQNNEKAIDVLVQLLNSPNVSDFTRKEVAESLAEIGPGNQQAIDALVQLLNSPDVDNFIRSEVAYSLEKIDPGNPKILLNCPNFSNGIRKQAVYDLGEIGNSNQKDIDALVQQLSSPLFDNTTHWLAAEKLKQTSTEKQLTAIAALKSNFNNSQQLAYRCYDLIWHYAHNLPYPDFYQAWHQDTLTNTATASLNIAKLPQILAEAINNQPELCSKVKLICIDTHQIIDPENPAPEIYDQMLNQNCPEWQNGYPDTMQKLKLYWNNLRRQSEIPLFFICYDSTALTTPTEFSDPFLKALSKFDRACVLCEPRDIPLRYFSPSQPDLVAAVVAWIRQSILENRHPI